MSDEFPTMIMCDNRRVGVGLFSGGGVYLEHAEESLIIRMILHTHTPTSRLLLGF